MRRPRTQTDLPAQARGVARVQFARRVGLRASVATIALLAAFAVANASAAPVVPLPRISPKTEETRSGGRPALVVRTLSVRRIHGKLTVRCNRCRRLVGRIRVSKPSRSSRRFSHVNWILRGGRAVKVTVVRKGWIGRYLLLTAQRRNGRLDLGYKESGCLNRHRNRVLCPRGTPPPQPAQVVQPSPVAPPAAGTPPPTGGSAQPPALAACAANAKAGFARVQLFRDANCKGPSVIVPKVGDGHQATFASFVNYDGSKRNVDNTRSSLAIDAGTCVRLFDGFNYTGQASTNICAPSGVVFWNLARFDDRASSMRVCATSKPADCNAPG